MKIQILTPILLLSFLAYGQTVKFVSQLDQDLTIKKVVVYPLVDNVKNIYAQTLTTHLENEINKDKQWTLINNSLKKDTAPEQFEENPELVQKNLKNVKADALFAGRISKGPNGIQIKITMYAGSNGYALASDTLNDYQGFDLEDLKKQTSIIYKKIKSKIPYSGTILSRKNQLVTVNLGSENGLKEGAELTAIQIIKIDRHPKYKFIVNTDTAILGKIKINKVDEHISFGQIISERDVNVITPQSKFFVDRFVDYPEIKNTADGKIQNELSDRPDSKVAFGDQPSEWVPDSDPTFGKLGISLGLGSNNLNTSLSTGSASGSNPVVPSIHILGEMWFDPHWYAQLNMKSFVYSVRNSLSGSNPSTLNAQLNVTSLVGGYNFLMAEDFFGPKVRLQVGYSTLAGFIDNSTPTAFTSTNYSGLNLGVSGSFPVELAGKKSPLYLGGKLNLFLTPSLSETPVSSGSSQNQITSFTAFMEYRIGHRMNLTSELNFDIISSTFGGGGSRNPSASSSSQSITYLTGGIEYLF